MMKRILCISIIFLMLVCNCVSVVWAYDEEATEINIVSVDDKKDEEVVEEVATDDIYNPMQELLEGMGIEIDTKKMTSHSDKITRGEFVTMFMQFVNVPITSGYTTQLFADVSNATLNYALKMALDQGCISPAENFYPDNVITYAQAYKIAVCALGYKEKAENFGGYPYGFSMVASDLDLDDGIPASFEDEMTYYDFFTLIENVGNAQLGAYVSSEGYLSYFNAGSTLFDNKGIIKFDGIVEMNRSSSLYVASATAKDGYIVIDDDAYLWDEAVPLGSYVDGYAIEDGDDYRIIALRDRSEKLKIESADIAGALESNTLKYSDEDGKIRKIKLDSLLAVIYNGKAYPAYTDDDFVFDDGYVEFIDNDDDGTYEIAHIRKSDTIFINKINAYDYKIYDANYGLVFDGNIDEIEYNIYYRNKEITIFDIALGSVINMYKSKDGKLVEMYVSTNQIKDTVNMQDATNNTITIGNTEYEFSDYFNTYYSSRVKVGLKYTFVIDSDNRIAAIMDDEYIINYGYLLYAKEDSLRDKVELGIFTQYGDFTLFETDERVEFNGTSVANGTVFSSVVNAEKKAVEQLVRYSLNSEGKLRMLDTVSSQTGLVSDNSNPKDRLTKYEYRNYGDSNVQKTYRSTGGIFVKDFAMSSSAVCFIVNPYETNIRERCDLLTLSNGDRLYANLFDVYDVNSSMIASALVYYNAIVPTPTVSSPSGVVESVIRGIDENNVDILIVTIYTVDGRFNTYYIEDFSILNTTPENAVNALSCGDIIRYKLDEDEKTIIALEQDFDYSTASVINYPPTDHGLNNREYYYGDVNRYSDNMMVLTARTTNSSSPDMSDESLQTLLYVEAPIVAVVDVDKHTIYEGSKDDIISYQQSGEYSTLIAYMNSAEAKFIAIYR